MKYPVLALVILLLLVLFAFKDAQKISQRYAWLPADGREPAHQEKPSVLTAQQVTAARNFVQRHPFNKNFGLMINMSLPSGKNRFFVYDFAKDSVVASGLVTHGNCYQYWLEGRKYSNKIGSGCTSVGKYKIGNSYYGKFGLAYKLYGLDSSNDNAFKRYVVMHAHVCVPDEERAADICQSNGCPTVSPVFLKKLQVLIDQSDKPVLLSIFE